jgi:hypothetical protein
VTKQFGDVASAAVLTVPRLIDGQVFDGSKDIDTGVEWISRHPGSPIPAARVTYYDKPDTAFANLPTVMDTGQGSVAYADNGTDHPLISNKAFKLPRRATSGQAFEYTYFDAGNGNLLTRIGATFRVDPAGATTDTWANALAIANGPQLNSGGTAYRIGLHLSVGTSGWGLTKASNATGSLVNTFFTDVNGASTAGFLNPPCNIDGQSEYTFEIWKFGTTAVVILPDGTRIKVIDTDIGAWATQYGYIELVMVAGNTDSTPAFTEGWYDVNGIRIPGSGGVVTRDVLDGNTSPKINMIKDTLGNNSHQIAAVPNAVNYVGTSGRAAGSPPYTYVGGSDTDIDNALVAKGKGRIKDGTTGRMFRQVPAGATVLTTNAAPVRNQVNRYNCTTGAANLSVPLPALSTLVDGDIYWVEKSKLDATTFTVTFTAAGADTFDDGVTTTQVLKVSGQLLALQVFSVGGALTWKAMDGYLSLAATDARYLGISAAAVSAAKLTTPVNIDRVPFDGSTDIGTGVWTPADSGWAAWTFDPAMCYLGGTALAAGILYANAVKIPKATTLASVVLNVMTAGATLTAGQCFAGIYQGNVPLAFTADQATNWQSTGLKTMALTGAPITVAAGLLYIVMWANGTTRPAMAAPIAATVAGDNPFFTPGNRSFFDSHTGLTTTASAPAAFGTPTVTAPFWAAVA